VTRRTIVLGVLTLFLTSGLFWAADAWARAGGGRSMGSRGSRSYSAPARPAPSPATPSQPAAPPASATRPAPQRSGWGAGLLGGLGGLLLGGLIGSLLFGGLAHGLFGGIGFLEILLIAGLAYFGLSYLRRRQQPMPASPAGHAPPPTEVPTWPQDTQSRATAVVETPAGPSDLERGLEHVRQMDPTFDAARFGEVASDIFFKVQAAWMARDVSAVRDLLTPEMHDALQQDDDRLKAEGRVNRLENIAVRSVDVTEAWQEVGRDFVTVRFLASVLDYAVDERSGAVVEGSRAEPVRFEEYWTFTRPVGPGPFRLSAIQQA
jgi:predicted lipid-binding transport protein (Tim44 family)